MPRLAKPMTAQEVANAEPGRHGLGNGLYLLARENGTRFWLFRWTRHGKMREMGLGRAPGREKDPAAVKLKDATEMAGELMKLVRSGVDPLAQRAANAAAAKAEAQDAAVKAITFRTVAGDYIKAHRTAWKNAKHAKQWEATLTTYAFPKLGDMPVADIETAHVQAILSPIWATKAETAQRVRGRIEAVLNYAATSGWRSGENPARWRGHLDNLLPSRGKVAPLEHHPALPWNQIAAFMVALGKQDGISARALAFAILTGARTGEVLGATWGEIDMAEKVWTIPANRMKAGREHRVPLSAPALTLLTLLTRARTSKAADAFVFPGGNAGRPLSSMALTMVLRRMNKGATDDAPPRWAATDGRAVVAHGFRSTFRDWTSETTSHGRDVAEAALAHTLGDKVEAAYRRGDLFEKRRKLMSDWATYCSRPASEGATVTQFRPRDSADTTIGAA